MLVAVGAIVIAQTGCGTEREAAPAPSSGREDAERQFDHGLAQLNRQVERASRQSQGERQRRTSEALAGLNTLGAQISAEVGAAIGPPGAGEVASGGRLHSGVAWSTIKVPIAIRVLDDAGGPDGLSAAQHALIEQALTASDNEAAADLFGELEGTYGGAEGAADAVTAVLRKGGDDETNVSTQGRDGFSPYGQTEWSLKNQEIFMSHLAAGCVADQASTRFVLELLGRVTSDTWGLGSAGVPALWKGGWGPDPEGGYLLRQMGVLEFDGEQAIVSLAVRPEDGTFESGQIAATRLAQWLARRAGAVAGVASGC